MRSPSQIGRALADRVHRRVRLREATPATDPTADTVRRTPDVTTRQRLRARIGRLPAATRVTPYLLRRGLVW